MAKALSVVKLLIYKVLISIFLVLIFQSYVHCSSSLRLDIKLFFSRYNWLEKIMKSNNRFKDIPVLSSESCELQEIISDERAGVPSLEELAKKLGYPIEKYLVETEDGYILTLFRIKHGKNKEDTEVTVRKPVMLQHGVLESAAVYMATSHGMAYYLANKGYDVWIGNSRGTMLSRRHKDEERHPDKKGTTFWEYSFHEMGVYDLPAVLGKIRKETEGQRVHYVGMSMGSTQFLVMASEIIHSQDWVDCVVLLGPVARPKHMGLLSGIAYFFSWSYFNALRALTKGESCVYRAKLAQAVYKFCTSKRQGVCKGVVNTLTKPKDGDNQYDFDDAVTSYLYSPAGASVKTFVHYLQIASSGKFQKFDYGKTQNKYTYNSKKPPKYKLKNIKKKLYLLVGGADDVATEVDVKWLQRQLPLSELITDQFKLFTHQNFHYSVNIDSVLFDTILDIFTKWESRKEDHSDCILK